VVKAARALLFGHVAECFGGRRRSLALVAEELHVATERDRRNLPARPVTVVETRKFRPKPSEKVKTLYAAQRATTK